MSEIINLASLQTLALDWGLRILTALAIFFIGRWLGNLALRVLEKALKRARIDEMLQRFIHSLAQTALLLLLIIAALSQLGLDTTSLVALVGAAGLAVGLALKESLGNLAAGVMLIVFRPFKLGDVIETGSVLGTVDRINIFHTLLRTPDNRLVILPNGALYNSPITNLTALPTRRIELLIGIDYKDDIRKARDIIERLMREDTRILPDPAPQVVVGDLADFSVNLIVRPWVLREDFGAVQFELRERIKLAFDEEGITIPYPHMVLQNGATGRNA